VAAIADPDLTPIVLTYDDIAYKTGRSSLQSGCAAVGRRA